MSKMTDYVAFLKNLKESVPQNIYSTITSHIT